MLTAEEINKNWETFASLAEKGSGQGESVSDMLNELGERIAICPATIKSYPGSLVEQNLKCLKACMAINKQFNLELSESSLVVTNLFRNIGMIGDLKNSLLIEQENEWRRKNMGEMFKYNPECSFMRSHDRSIFLLQHYGIQLSHDEYLGIAAGGGNNEEYKFGEPALAFAVYAALRFVGFQDKE